MTSLVRTTALVSIALAAACSAEVTHHSPAYEEAPSPPVRDTPPRPDVAPDEQALSRQPMCVLDQDDCASCLACADQSACAQAWEACQNDKHCPVYRACLDDCIDACDGEPESCLDACVLSNEGCAGLHLAPAAFNTYLACAGCEACGDACGDGVLCGD